MGKWKNYIIRGLVHALKLFTPKGKGDRFLIVSTTGLGDTLWATPAIRALRTTYPHAYIGCLTTSLGAAVLKNNPHLNELFIFNNPFSLISLYFKLRQRKIGSALLFHTSQRAILPLCGVIGTFHRIGTAGLQKNLDDLLTDALPWNSTSKNLSHEIERRLDIVRAAGARPVTYTLDFIIEEEHRKQAQELVPHPFVIGFHPGAKDRFKQWPTEYFVEVAQKLRQMWGCHIVITGTRQEEKMVQKLCEQIGGAQAIIQPLPIMAAVLEKLDLFITNDTGPLHLALAMQTPTIALFAPTNPAICGPYHTPTAQVIQASPTCFPCLRKACRDPFCMRQISPNRVIEVAVAQLNKRRSRFVSGEAQ